MSKLLEEVIWLAENPQFEERPATLREFLGADYLDIEDMVRPRIREELAKIIGEEVNPYNPTAEYLAMITGGIGIGKTTVAAIVLPYLVHWTLCLKDPQKFFGLLPGSRIAFMQMSTSSQQAKEVIFGDIKARVNHSPWFKRYPFDKTFKNQFRFAKDVWIVPGDSAETTFEGYNILGGILDEADSHKVTDKKCYATEGFRTIYNRMSSRFEDRGFLLIIGQMKSSTGFAAQKYQEFQEREDAYAVRMAIWESRGDAYFADEDGRVEKFVYDTYRREVVPREVFTSGMLDESDHLLEIPNVYKDQFRTNPEQALKDLAGIPPAVGDPFISLAYKIDECVERWEAMFGEGSPVDIDGRFDPQFRATDRLRRVIHLDLAYSAKGDGLGLSMGHVYEMREIDGELKPFIVIDFMKQIRAAPGTEIFFGDVRREIYSLRDDLKFNIDLLTTDGFESHDFRSQMSRRRISTDEVSVDKTLLPYYDLREAIYEDRIAFPRYMVRSKRNPADHVEIASKELRELSDEGKKVDHPPSGSKDVADTLAAVCYSLMGDRRYQRKVASIASYKDKTALASGDAWHPAYMGDSGARAPIPPPMRPT